MDLDNCPSTLYIGVMRAHPSIRRRLLIQLLTLLALIAGSVYWLARGVAFTSYQQAKDQSLSAVAQVIADSVVLESGRLNFDLPYSAFEVLAYLAPEAVFYQVASNERVLAAMPICLC